MYCMLSAPNLASLGLCDILWDITAAMWKNTKTGHQPVKSPPTKVTTDQTPCTDTNS